MSVPAVLPAAEETLEPFHKLGRVLLVLISLHAATTLYEVSVVLSCKKKKAVVRMSLLRTCTATDQLFCMGVKLGLSR
jgi:hypothetical protein